MLKADFSRQSFLGADSQQTFESLPVAIVGLGGGGSQIAQQLAHIGFVNFILFDSDTISDSNLNRLVGSTQRDVDKKQLKVDIAKRLIKGIRPKASVKCINARWQNCAQEIRRSELIFGCVDSFGERRELEMCSRRYLIPYIDIGMDVHIIGDSPPRMAGQIILSMPNDICMYCMDYLNQTNLEKEAALYGDVGGRPQVVWSNAILASTAVGIAVQLLTNWTRNVDICKYYSFDGNSGTVQPHQKDPFVKNKICTHYHSHEVGDPIFMKL
jgi:hypothetical protein